MSKKLTQADMVKQIQGMMGKFGIGEVVFGGGKNAPRIKIPEPENKARITITKSGKRLLLKRGDKVWLWRKEVGQDWKKVNDYPVEVYLIGAMEKNPQKIGRRQDFSYIRPPEIRDRGESACITYLLFDSETLRAVEKVE